MEYYVMKEKILNLGKLLVKDLELEPGNDNLSIWMAHYIAEKIVISENATGKKKQDAEKQCFDTILKLWKHRAYLKDGQRPFENYEIIFNTIERLNPDNKHPFYYAEQKKKGKTSCVNEINQEVQKWLNVALSIDQAARVWIESVINQAISIATNEKVKDYLKNTYNVDKELDTKIIVNILGNQLEENEKNTINKLRKERRKELRSRIKQLEAFSKINDELCRVFKQELDMQNDKM